MKKVLTFVACLMAVAAFASYGTGWGKTVTATTTTAQEIVAGNAAQLSVFNTSGAVLHVLVNTTTAAFDVRYAAGTTIPIPNNASFDFKTDGNESIRNVCMRTASGSGTVYLGGF